MIDIKKITKQQALDVELQGYYIIDKLTIVPVSLIAINVSIYKDCSVIIFDMKRTLEGTKFSISTLDIPESTTILYKTRETATERLIEVLRDAETRTSSGESRFVREYLDELKRSYPDKFI